MAGIWVPLVRLEEIMGRDAAHALATARGGNSVYIGQTPSEDLIALCGDDTEAAKRLCVEYGGSDIVLPSVLVRPVAKKTRIAAMIEAGASTLEVVKEVGCTARYVAAVRRDLSGSDRIRPEPKKPAIVAMLRARRKWSDQDIAAAVDTSVNYVAQLRSSLKRGLIA